MVHDGIIGNGALVNRCRLRQFYMGCAQFGPTTNDPQTMSIKSPGTKADNRHRPSAALSANSGRVSRACCHSDTAVLVKHSLGSDSHVCLFGMMGISLGSYPMKVPCHRRQAMVMKNVGQGEVCLACFSPSLLHFFPLYPFSFSILLSFEAGPSFEL